MYWYIYEIIIMINSDNGWSKVIWYIHKKPIYSDIYPSTYDIRVQILLSKHVLVHVRDENYNMLLLSYVSTIYVIYVI